jgi:LysM repeat protein
MGQLEKYGLYVMVLLIFLISGVSLMGNDEVAEREKQGRVGGENLDTGAVAPAPGPGEVKVTPFDDLIEPIVPKPPAKAAPMPNQPAPGNDNSPAPPPGPATPSAEEVRPKHVIATGDTFEAIALQHFKDRRLQTEIQRLNPKAEPRRLQPGKELLLPTASEVASFLGKDKPVGPVSDKAADQPLPAGTTRYTVKRGDVLERIAIQQLGSRKFVDEILQLNSGLVPENLKAGSTILLPKK